MGMTVARPTTARPAPQTTATAGPVVTALLISQRRRVAATAMGAAVTAGLPGQPGSPATMTMAMKMMTTAGGRRRAVRPPGPGRAAGWRRGSI
jgi:hypothetical protein